MLKYTNPNDQQILEICQRPSQNFEDIKKIVKEVFSEVESDPDKALLKFSQKYDKQNISSLSQLVASEQEIMEAKNLLSEDLKKAIKTAYQNITKFHLAQKGDFQAVETFQGIVCTRRSIPIQKVGLYIPGGTAPLFSTVLMLGIPAKLAGCTEITISTPPNKKGLINPAILFTAELIGIKKIIKMGGSQAIAQMVFGSSICSKVDKIFGPGNRFVTFAKSLAQEYTTAIDMPAGPSEVLVIADEKANPVFVASDLLAQAEHGEDSQVVLVTNSSDLANKVEKEILNQLQTLTRKEIIEKCLENSRIVIIDSLKKAFEISNIYAPEHLILQLKNPEKYLSEIINAGSVFVGENTPESLGDYCSGTNHTLPTGGFARSMAGVSLDSFVKKITFQTVTKQGLNKIASTVKEMALKEGLDAHWRAVEVRVNDN